METLVFKKGDPVLQGLAASDERMALLINKIGEYTLNLKTDYFPSLVRAIIGQQLSVGAARTIWQRAVSLCSVINPEKMVEISVEALKMAGISGMKARYIKDLSHRVLNGEIELDRVDSLSDTEVVSQLIKIKGIGVWTAEMFLIFSLGRLDVLSVADLGLKRSIQWLYGIKKVPAERTIRSLGKKWAPYRTVGSLYLWEVINQGLIKESPDNVLGDNPR